MSSDNYDEDYDDYEKEDYDEDGEERSEGDDNDYYGDGDDFGMAERDAFNRVGGFGNGVLGANTNWKEKRDPYVIFKEQVNATVLSFNDTFFENMGLVSDIKNILDKVERVKYVEYKNPYAFVLGYLSYGKSPEYIRNNIFSKLVRLNQSNSNNVTEEDVIRYMRLFRTL